MLQRLSASVLGILCVGWLASCNESSGGDPVSSDADSLKAGVLDTSTYGIPWSSSAAFGTLTDSRDGHVYRTVKIGAQTWMAQNLNYASVDSSWCDGGSDSCAKYGRLYSWTAMMAGDTASKSNPSGVRGICPNDWHVPSSAEWRVLVANEGLDTLTGEKLKSSSGWNSNGAPTGNGTDAYGFRMLPAGWRVDDGSFWGRGNTACIWSASNGYYTTDVDLWTTYSSDLELFYSPRTPATAGSVRCVAN